MTSTRCARCRAEAGSAPTGPSWTRLSPINPTKTRSQPPRPGQSSPTRPRRSRFGGDEP
jgi:hypothetical protein